jgi:hypothetical protein
MYGSGKLGWNEDRLRSLPEEGQEEGLQGIYGIQDCSQAILPGLIQRLRDAGLTKALRTPGLQDFLRIMKTGQCTWDHLPSENFPKYKLWIMRSKFISPCPGYELTAAIYGLSRRIWKDYVIQLKAGIFPPARRYVARSLSQSRNLPKRQENWPTGWSVSRGKLRRWLNWMRKSLSRNAR